MKTKCTEDRQEAAILVEKLKNTQMPHQLRESQFCRYLGKQTSSPLCEDCRILQVQTSDGSVSISKKDVHTYTQGGHRTRKHNCKGVPPRLIPGGGEMVEPWVCTQVLQGPTRMHAVCPGYTE